MEEMPKKKTLSEQHSQHRQDYWPQQNWRSWGSWFSWGSPIGLSLFYAIVVISTGIYIWLVHHK